MQGTIKEQMENQGIFIISNRFFLRYHNQKFQGEFYNFDCSMLFPVPSLEIYKLLDGVTAICSYA